MLYSTLSSKGTEAPVCKGLLVGGKSETMRMSSLPSAGIANPNNRIAEIRSDPRKRIIVIELFSGVRREYSAPRPRASETMLLEGFSERELVSIGSGNQTRSGSQWPCYRLTTV